MTKLPELKTAKVIKALNKLGFHELRHKGGHAVCRHEDGRWTTVPIHPTKSVDPDLLGDILKQIKVTPGEFLNAIGRHR
ncbi:MAG: type II toxin-antitoxin system HicA family toxin [Chloroflexota bacterium]|nr:type II toxin-antitoxin system HicA family toxin [Chloroflexota bacterium]